MDCPKFIVGPLAIGLIATSVMYAPVPFMQPFFFNKYGMSKSAFGALTAGLQP